MNPLVKKEIRLLLPSWLAVLLLEMLLPWCWHDPTVQFEATPSFIFCGVILLAVDSFGREFSLGTFPSLLAQPMARQQIWRIKITLLLLAATLVFATYFASGELRLHLGFNDRHPVWLANPALVQREFLLTMFSSGVVMLVALIGGLWTTLLFRQIAAAFWITLLVPLGLFLTVEFFLPVKWETDSSVCLPLFCSLAGIYIVSGFWLAHRLFHRAQDVAWLSGAISFSRWRYYDTESPSFISVRRRKPLSALLKKEFQLHSISLVAAGVLLILHLAVFFLRATYTNFHRNSLASVVTDFFWLLWLVMPAIIGCMAVAEERKLGVTETQFCLPVSRRFQFAAKLIPPLIFGTLLGGILPVGLEMAARHFGAPSEFFKPENQTGNQLGLPAIQLFVLAAAAGLALISCLASTLARNFLQALSITIVTVVGGCLFFNFLTERQPGVNGQNGQYFMWGMQLWGAVLPLVIGSVTAMLFIPFLAYRNFSHFVESGRLWRRNIFATVGTLLFIFGSSAAIYHRVWEIFEPVEPPHGPAIFSLAHPPKLCGDGQAGLQLRLPDGRIWFTSLGYPFFQRQPSIWKLLWLELVRPLPVSAGPQQFIAGSNWVSATTKRIEFWNSAGGPRRVTGYLDAVGVQADGSLWISSEAKPFAWTGAKMIRFGDETNWQQMVRQNVGLLLLKRDGTLWQWGTNRLDWTAWWTNWPTVRATKPQPISTNSDWVEIASRWNDGLARKKDGSVWNVDWNWKLERETNYDQIELRTLSNSGMNSTSYVGRDGTLWVSYRNFDGNRVEGTRRFFQIGKETNWVATAMNWDWMLALKSDGSLWQWHFHRDSAADFPEAEVKIPPTRLGIHNDWIGLTSAWDGAVALAADGSLWFWPNYAGAMLKAPKQPQPLGHVF